MLVQLDTTPDNAPCCIVLHLVNQRVAKELEMEEGFLIQTDWDWPGLATDLGWQACKCGGTDGTVDCKPCKRTASEMIQEAREYLDARDGQKFRGKLDHYFNL